MRKQLLDALDEVMLDHSVASTQGMVRAIRRHAARFDPELDTALIRAQFMVASRRYLKAPQRLIRALQNEAMPVRTEKPPRRSDPPSL
jgi:hypothetical protein